MNEEYLKIKSENKYKIVIVKTGLFYSAYGKDAIIINEMTNYSLFF